MSWRDIDLNRLFTLDMDPMLSCGETSYDSAILFMMMAEGLHYKSFLELGTSGGYVSMLMGRYFELKGGGLVHTCDPEQKGNIINEETWENAEVRYFEMTSDDYFAQLGDDVKFDMVFIDGCRYPDFLIRDTENSLKHLSKFGTLVYHDLITLPTVTHFLYKVLPTRGEFEVVSWPFRTGVAMVRRSEREDWLGITKGIYPDHGYVMNKVWVDLKEVISRYGGG